MKSLSLSRPHLIIMVGVSGSGKSFFVEHFSETFSAPLISWNHIRSELFNEPTYTRDEDAIIERVASYALAQLLKTKATILYEGGTITQTARQALAKTARQAGYEPLFIWVQTDAATAKARALKQGVPSDIYDAAIRRFTPPKDDADTIVISGKHTYASQLKIVLRRLSAPRAGVATEAPAATARTTERQAPAGHRVRIQ